MLNRKAFFAPLLRILLGTLLAIPLLMYPFLYFNQERLLFPGASLSSEEYQALQLSYGEFEHWIEVADGIKLHGWLLLPESPKPAPLLMVFGGNAEEMSAWIDRAVEFPHHALLLFNQRGYGVSQGKPGEAAFFADALLLYDHFKQHPAIDAQRISVIGRSIGTGAAVYLAAQRPLQKVILITPFDSITAVAQGVYPYAPVAWLLKHPFDSLSRAPRIKTSLLALIAGQDTVIPPKHARRLVAAWAGDKQVREFPNADHETIIEEPAMWQAMREFLQTEQGINYE